MLRPGERTSMTRAATLLMGELPTERYRRNCQPLRVNAGAGVEGPQGFRRNIRSDLQGSPLWSVFLEPGRAVKSMSGDVGRHYPQAKLFNESPRMLNDLLHEGCR